MNELVSADKLDIKSKIYTIRGKQVMLDRDLAVLYGVETKRLTEQVKRNIKRFPEDFRFQLTKDEYEVLRSQNATLKLVSAKDMRGAHTKYLPYVFTEQGVSMLSSVLKSDIAIEVSVKIIREFVSMRRFISQNATIFKRLETLEQNQLITNTNIDKIFKALENKEHIKEQGVFFNGQIFDAHKFVSDLIRKAKSEIILIDNYIDDTTLALFEKNQNIDVHIYTHTISKSLQLDLAKYNKQYKQISLHVNKNFHDRFLVIDKKELYLVGASLKDLGKKVFGFSKINDFSQSLLKSL